ncbi:MAG: transcription elongation factor GreA [Armatimonadetes bacterium]|nr:transcription elongation factor GreA [Armatimonadota bacterium]
MRKVLLTREGYEKIQQELKDLKEVQRPRISKQIAEARSHGDIRENAEYHGAKEQQAMIEGRIRDLEFKISLAEIVEKAKEPEEIGVGVKVTLRDFDFDENVEYAILDGEEITTDLDTISAESPLGKVLLGRKVGDIVEAEVPAGVIRFEVLEIEAI